MTLNRWARMGLVFAITSTMAFWAYSQAPGTAPKAKPVKEAAVENTDAGVAAPVAQAQEDAGPAAAPIAAPAEKAEAPAQEALAKEASDKKEKYNWAGSSAEKTAKNFLKLLSTTIIRMSIGSFASRFSIAWFRRRRLWMVRQYS